MAKRIWDSITPLEKDAIDQGARLLRELRDKVDPAWRERSSERSDKLVTGPRLREVREARQISQEEMASRLGRTQSAVSQIEGRGDLLMSTVVQYLEAADGKLVHFTVRFPEGTVDIAPLAGSEPGAEG